MNRAVFILLMVTILSITASPAFSESYHFFNLDNRPLPQYEFIYRELVKFFQDSVPEKITVVNTTGKASRFDYGKERVLISEYHLKNDPVGIVAHESCHLSMENYTKGASVKEEFRFLDEGFAEIFHSIINNKFEEYKNEALAVAAVQNRKSNLGLARVQRWSEYFGSPETKTNFHAYPVGASFVFFAIDTYGMERFFALLKDISGTNKLDESFQNVFQKGMPVMEKDWLDYLSTTERE